MVGTAASERGDVVCGGDTLEAGDEHDVVLVEGRAHTVGAHVEDPIGDLEPGHTVGKELTETPH